MKVEYIDGHLLKSMIIAGAQALENNKQIVNALNVFPVPDGDTGTNMSLTMQSAVKEVKNCKSNDLSDIANAAANGSLMGARGNSGVILSQLFRGFAKSLRDKEQINTIELAEALKQASDTAYKAVMKPTEGTILTVARESAEKALILCKKEKDIAIFIEKVIAQAEDTLKRTPEMLAVLKEAGVVDSGGKGLVYIFQGALGVITGKEVVVEDLNEMDVQIEQEHEDLGDIEFGYCTEFMINGTDINIEKFKSTIVDYGDSMLVVGNESLVKVHIHTNHPGSVMEHALKLGQLTDIKIDNMRKQHRNELFEEKPSQTQPKISKKYGFVTVTMGDGLTKIFKDLNVDHVIEGGQTMNPSTEDFIKAIEEINADTIFILPNNSNIIMAANQAQKISSKKVVVIPSKSVPQGIAALVAFNEDMAVDRNETNMNDALKSVVTGQVTYAVRDTSINDIAISEGDILGIGNNEIKSVGSEINEVTMDLLNKIVTEDHEIITIFYGAEISEDEANELAEEVENAFSDCEIELYYGGQSIYYYVLSVE